MIANIVWLSDRNHTLVIRDPHMKLANLEGRAVLIASDGTAHDIHELSGARFGPDPASLFPLWDEVSQWAAQLDELADGIVVDDAKLGPPSPLPRQIIAFGLNYADHAQESGFEAPAGLPPVFPKFVSSLSGPVTTVALPEDGRIDWEVELVVVIGRPIDGPISERDAWDHVAGVMAGQDISDRATQFSTPAPQFGLGKSFPGFAPTGPWIVTPDELPDREDVELGCTLDGTQMQTGSTKQLLVPIPRLLAGLSGIISLYPGDLVFTGTPEGVGVGREPQLFIQPGQELVTSVAGVGELRQRFVRPESGHESARRALTAVAS
ncbi:fumarylacetoacetate hydrolase family protein [Streptomyces sp. NPDC047081]|uniref:fumarylacetoacetate hydrolase family protein n=1 Tax=Streptomyces sp. NPDC047081 TaxID=3154706 RepID=UPI0034077692